ncbi:toprim domain-containing protein [Paenibacillus sp. NPDC057967]|uniref:toprim domain-containing protein n=1 Tax=Paenibacillus sp. NPDC057967 TaxID=3346293 RepID=UPI0036D8B9F0
MIAIRGPNGAETSLPVDIRAELEEFPWTSATWSSDKLIAASPFRYERHPSFAVIFEHGGWRDYGALDPRWQSGSFIRLLSFLRQETYEETEDYLAVKYGVSPRDPTAEITLKVPNLIIDKPRTVRIGTQLLDQYNFRSPYLGSRGISESVQQLMRIGYDRQRRAITIPWFNPEGSLGNVKYRKVADKTFWYAKAGRPIREMLYGINVAYERRIKRAAIVEAEVDAMTLMSRGIFAVATGGTAFTRAKAELLLRSPIEELTLYRDNDGPGRAWRNAIVRELAGKMDVRLALIPRRYGKDVNEAVNAGWNPLEAKVDKCRMIAVYLR